MTEQKDIVITPATIKTELVEQALPSEFMGRIGVKEEQLGEIIELVNELDSSNPVAVTSFGQAAANHTVEYADKMLAMVNTGDLGEASSGLKQVLTKAKSINVSALGVERSKVPFLGRLIDHFKIKMSGVLADFQSARESIDTTLDQIRSTQEGLEQRIKDLETAYNHVQDEFQSLGKYIAAGRVGMKLVEAEIENLEASELTPLTVQKISDLRAYQEKLDKRISDLMVLQQNALNTLPAIRMVQTNNAMLVDKYNTIATLTIPTWKRQMMLGLALEEQSQAVGLANDIDDFTNKLIRQQADVLKKNTIATAKSNQRLVIDVSTIEYTQKTLIDTVTETLKIQNEARGKREAAEQRILELRKDLHTKLIGKVESEVSTVH